jgi:hypothetical protein
MLKTSESPAVAVARAHVEAWSNHDYHTAQKSLAADVKATITTTMGLPNTDLIGVDDYMHRLTEFAKNVEPGSLRVIASKGDEQNALLMVTLRSSAPEYGTVTLQMGRLYLLDDNAKIKVEQVIYYYVAPDTPS